jgi:glycine/D-amino acid oxidase-like deaminating enzyme
MKTEIRLPQTVDVLDRAEVCVAGGGIAGVAAALIAAAAGLETVLLEERGALGWEVSHGLDLFLSGAGQPPGALGRIVAQLGERNAARDGTLDPVACEVLLDERILAAKIRMHLRALAGSWDRSAGLVRATTKSGPMAVQARVVIDATENARLARGAGAKFSTPADPQLRTRAFLLCAVEPPAAAESISTKLAERVTVRPTLWPNEAHVSFTYRVTDATRAESDSRMLMARIIEMLRKEKAGFQTANLSLSAHESFALNVPKLDEGSLPDGLLVAGPACLGRRPTLEERAALGERAAANACERLKAGQQKVGVASDRSVGPVG